MSRALVMLALLLAPAVGRGMALPPTREVRLKNGALVILAEKHDVPMIAFHALLRGGSLADPAGKEGVASLTGGLLRKGAGKRTAQEIAALVDGLGASLDTGSSLELSYASAEFLSRDQTVMLDLLADVLRRPVFPPEEFEKLKSQTIDAITSAKDDPGSVLGEYGYAFLFGDHPYGRPADGDEATNAAVTRDDVLRYYRENYGGDRLILTVVGDFSPAAMEQKIRARFDDWGKASGAIPEVQAAERKTGRRVLLVDKPDATQTYFWIANVGVRRMDPDRVPLDVANTAYGGRYTSILNTALRIEGGLTYGASLRAPRFTQPGSIAISSFTKTESTAKAVDKALETLEKVRAAGVDSTVLASSKTYMIGQFPPRLETEGQIAGALADLAFYGEPREELEHYTDLVAAVRGEDVRRVIQRVYPPGKDLTLVFVGKAAAIRSVVSKYGPVTEVPITEPMLGRLRPAARRYVARAPLLFAARVPHDLRQDELDLSVHAAELVRRPLLERVPELGTDSEEKGLPLRQRARLLVEGSGVQDRGRGVLAAEDDEQVADHRRFPLLVQLHHVVLAQPRQRHLHHAHRALHDARPRRDDGARLLPLEHGLRDLGRVGEVAEAGLDHLDARRLQPLEQLGFEKLRDLVDAAA